MTRREATVLFVEDEISVVESFSPVLSRRGYCVLATSDPDKALAYICSHKGVWLTTGGEIADWYYQHYYEDPGPMDS